MPLARALSNRREFPLLGAVSVSRKRMAIINFLNSQNSGPLKRWANHFASDWGKIEK
jgi:hypothetical protein